ncbi:uncharacterized protein LOC134692190 [Mytilus trossulus]|uniref:uncharacterized protein LOC134692190 n=1 Tax=Mytilus trossulus TaxID=6551 RepID=UPI0030040BA4
MKIRQFIYNEMKIQKPLEFGNIHRFGKSEPGKPRPIIARFLYYSDLDMVKKAGRNLRGTFYGVNEQFPPEIEEQRRKLYPIAKQARKEKLKVVMKRDKLYINDKLVNPDEIADDTEHKEPQRPNKRPRVNSTPERDETKTDDLDVIDLPGYKFVMKNRSHLNRVKSGGIVLGFKESLSDHISAAETDSKYILWFKIDKHVVKLQQDILCGIVYIPPENSVYCVGDPFSEIESEFLNFSTSHDNICLFGDFNARTAEESDFDVVNFEEFSGMLDIENEGVCTLDELNINRLRKILNSSVLFSDIHNPLSLKITCYEKQNDVSHDDEMHEEKIKRWENEQLDTFISNIDRLKVNEILAQLTEMVENTSENSIINKVVEDVCHLLTNAAKSTFGTFTKRRKHTQNIKKSKPWFDSECKEARKKFRSSRRKLKRNNTDDRVIETKKLEKSYKRVMDKSIRKHRKKIRHKIENLRSINPKEYWKILNDGKRGNNPCVPINILFDYFKNLNLGNSEDEEIVLENLNNVKDLNVTLNSPITEEEIEKSLRKLKNNKSSGDDMIVNEYLKHSFSVMSQVFVKLFNIIFDSGTIPENWLSGNIIPLFKNKGNKHDPSNFRPITVISCFGKLFTSILNSRLNKFSDDFCLLCQNQAGFREGYSTTDNLFVIYMLISIMKNKKKKLFCAFVDFAKAFDTVWRKGLWHKLLVNDINVPGN